MQLFAHDSSGELQAAKFSKKGVNYFCIECHGVVRLRLGLHRRPHFFHLHPTVDCYQNGKSLIHLQTQCYLQELLPPLESVLEKRFPLINRIADVVWENRKLIFEIQCSPISLEEVRERNRDYLSQGYQVVWILHDKRYNKKNRTGAELFLAEHPHYFTNIDAEGKGMIYDQFSIFQKNVKKFYLTPLPVDLSQPLSIETAERRSSLSLIGKRLLAWPLHFSGDLLDQSPLSRTDYLEQALALEKSWLSPNVTFLTHVKNLIQRWVFKPYRLFLQILLEKACK
jgi:competence protein CoiA